MKLPLDNYVPGLLLWLSNKVSRTASQVYKSRFGIGITDWRLLAYFEITPWSTAARACEGMGLDKAAVSRSVAFLLEEGLLQARPAGLRKVEYAATANGRKLHDRVLRLALEREAELMAGISDVERALLIRLLHQMLRNAEAAVRGRPGSVVAMGQASDEAHR